MKRMIKSFDWLWNAIGRDEMRILPGNLAFFLVLSIIPIITLIGYIASFFSISIDSLIEFMFESFPKEVSDLLIPIVNGKGVDANILFFMVVGFFVASNGAHSIIIASNALYNFEHADYIKQRVKAVFLTFVLVLLFFFIIIVLAFGNNILQFLLSFGPLQDFSNELYYMFAFLKWPVAFILILFAIKLIYTMAPDQKVSSYYVNRGAFFTTLCWILVTAVYSYYAAHIANYDIFYGSLSNLVVMMMWVYFLALILVIGIAINANYYQTLQKLNKV